MVKIIKAHGKTYKVIPSPVTRLGNVRGAGKRVSKAKLIKVNFETPVSLIPRTPASMCRDSIAMAKAKSPYARAYEPGMGQGNGTKRAKPSSRWKRGR